MDILSLNKSKPKLIAGGVVKPSQITTGVIQVETIACGAELPVSTGGGVVDSDVPVTPTVRYTLTINALPTNAVVMINGVKRNTASIIENMTARYTVSADGYVTKSGEVVMTQDQTITVELVEIPKYTFSISPVPSNAVVTINGEVRNSITVLENTEITWSVEAENYIAQSGKLVLTENTNLSVSLEKVKYTFTINATPSNAIVKINGETTNSITVASGTEISYEVSADGYATETGTLTLTENKTINVALSVIPKYTFAIVATPKNAVVTINGQAVNSITAVENTNIEWSVEADDYVSQSGTLTLTKNETITVNLVAIPQYTFVVVPTPSNAVVIINGVQRSSITAYENTVIDWSVTADGYTGQSGTHTLVANYTLEVSLEVASSSEIKAFSATNNTTWLVDENGDLYGCGRNQYNQQSDGTTTDVTTFTKRASNAKDVCASDYTTWYITNEGDLYGCGYNGSGGQSSGDEAIVKKFTKRASNVKKVVASTEGAWYLTESGDLYGCGINGFGNQGSGSTADVLTFTKRASNVKDFRADNSVTWYLTESGDLYGCGRGAKGAMGNGSTTDVKTFTKRASNVKAFYADANVTWYLTNTGDLYGCGLNNFGQQGNGTTDNVLTFTKRASGVMSFAASLNLIWYLTENGDIYGCGRNNQGQQSDGTTTNVTAFTKRVSNVKTVYATSIGSWYVDKNDDLYGCGTNNFGQHSNGTKDDVLTFTKRASNVKNVYLSTYTTWYEDKNGNLYGCGLNSYGQQGNGTTEDVLTLTKVSI